MKKLISSILVATLAVSMLLTGCGGSSDSDTTSTSKDSVSIVLTADPTGFDPQTTLDASAMMVMYNVFDTLVDSDSGCSSDIEPALAESWEISDDGLVYTFYLQEGVKFHDGSDFTADDAKYTMERAMTEPATASYCTMIESVDVVDDFTLDITLNIPFANFLQNIGGIFFGVVSEEAVTEAGDDFGRQPIGTGAYTFDEWVSGDKVTLTANADYWGGEPEITNVTYKILPDTSTALIALENGEVDAFPNIAYIDTVTAEENEDISLYSSPSGSIKYIGFNVEVEPFDNELVRQAIKYATNKDDIFDGAADGDGIIANTHINETMDGYDADSPEPNQYDLEKAKELMIEAGYEEGFSVTCILSTSTSEYEKIAEILQAQLAEINIDMTIEPLEKGTYFEQCGNGNYEMYIGGLNWAASDDMLTYLFQSDGGFNWGYVYSNDEIDALLLEARQETDQAVRAELYQEVNAIVDEDCNKIPLYFPNQYFAADSDLLGVEIVDNCYFPVANWSWAE